MNENILAFITLEIMTNNIPMIISSSAFAIRILARNTNDVWYVRKPNARKFLQDLVILCTIDAKEAAHNVDIGLVDAFPTHLAIASLMRRLSSSIRLLTIPKLRN
jgi:hypothetical protein